MQTNQTNQSIGNKELLRRACELAAPFRVTKGEEFRLKDTDPGDTLDFD
ncbi:hypothetical protein [Synechococcus sp. 1G10]